MRPTIEQKKLWTDALRSGKYKQGKGSLAIQNEDGSREFCCMGVLCDVDGRGEWTGDGFSRRLVYSIPPVDYSFSVPPIPILEGYGLASPDGEDRRIENREVVDILAHMNDGLGMSFPDIADWIDANLPVQYTGETGCLVDGRRGIYAILDVIKIAQDYGFKVDEEVQTVLDEEVLWDVDLHDVADDAENFLNRVVADDNHSFGWMDGEFYYNSHRLWEMDGTD